MELEEDSEITSDELVDKLCWMWAKDGERFYPPDETAKGCIEDWKEGLGKELDEGDYRWELGQHERALDEAREKFRHLKSLGFDPEARAERFIEEAREHGDDLSSIDWEWWEEVVRY